MTSWIECWPTVSLPFCIMQTWNRWLGPICVGQLYDAQTWWDVMFGYTMKGFSWESPSNQFKNTTQIVRQSINNLAFFAPPLPQRRACIVGPSDKLHLLAGMNEIFESLMIPTISYFTVARNCHWSPGFWPLTKPAIKTPREPRVGGSLHIFSFFLFLGANQLGRGSLGCDGEDAVTGIIYYRVYRPDTWRNYIIWTTTDGRN